MATLLARSPQAPAAETTYVVRSGDTLGGIALRQGVDIDDLCRANGIQRKTPIRIGQKLVVPDKAPRRAAPRATPSGKHYVVRSGDTLGGVALRFHVSADDLGAANGVGAKGTIRVGQKLVIPSPSGKIGAREHEVAPGDTLGKIAHRYDVAIDELARANRMKRSDPIRIGQSLLIPGSDGSVPAPAASAPDPDPAPDPPGGMQMLAVPGAPPAYYYEPTGPGRQSLRPVLMYLHGRGAVPGEYCKRWAQVARRFGWLVCPQGPEDRGGGRRGWSNNWPAGRHVVKATLDALRSKFGRRVQLYGNTIIGFSEGAFVAMNVGLYEPQAFNRWLILGADTDYWTPRELEALQRNRGRIRRVYLITGEDDIVCDETEKVRGWLRKAGIPVRVSTPSDMGHLVALESKAAMYKAAISWLGG